MSEETVKPQDVRVTHSGFEFDMTAWGAEKSEGLMRALSELAGYVQRRTLEGAEMEDAREAFWDACVQAARLLGFFWGVTLTHEEVTAIFKGGRSAYAAVAQKHGFRTRSLASDDYTEDEIRASRQRLLLELDELTRGPRSNRTQVHEALRSADLPRRDDLLGCLSELVEKVTQGELQWETFVAVVQDLARRHRRYQAARREGQVAEN